MKWEYWILYEKYVDMAEFNKMGQEEWELVSVDNGIAYFKRPYYPSPTKEEIQMVKQELLDKFDNRVNMELIP